MTQKPLLALHQLSLYNTGRMAADQVIAAFAARRQQFERIVAEIVAEKPKSRAQHHLVVGQRGMGKTMLLARIAAELRARPDLADRFIPLVFAEEQYAVDRLSKFWLNCLDSLADARELDKQDVAEIDETVARLTADAASAGKDDRPLANQAYEAFARMAQASGQRPVLLVDNLQLVFERLDEGAQHSLRELLMRPGSPILVGTSPSPPPESQDYGAAFYDHFKVHYLRPLDESEMRALLVHLATMAERDDVRQHVLKHPHRLAVLRQLTGGNPRTTVTLFFLYGEDFAPSVFGDLEGLLDRVTPLYKARFEELTPQQQVVASAIANHWDPITGPALAAATGLPPGTISSQLDRLEKIGFVERTELFGDTRTGYQLAERFFNIWFLMRSASRRQRREVEFLTRFLESFYEPAERSRLAHELMREGHFSPDRYLWSRAVAASLAERETAEELTRHAELTALQEQASEARARLRELIDFDSLPAATLAFDDLRKKLKSLVPDDCGMAPDDFAKAVLGDRVMFMNGEREKLAARSGKLSHAEIESVLDTIRKARAADEQTYSVEAVDWFAKRLATGQIRGLYDTDDWNRAFHQADGKPLFQLLVDAFPEDFGSILSESSIERITTALQPSATASASSWTKWGRTLHLRLARSSPAEHAYRQAIQADPNDAWPLTRLGDLLRLDFGRFEEAEVAYRQAISLAADLIHPWIGLGRVLTRLQRFDEAKDAYEKATKINPEFAWGWTALGNLYYDLERFNDAEQAFRTAIAHEPKDSWSYIYLGSFLCDDLQRLEEAESAYREGIQCDARNPWLWRGLGRLLRRLQRFAEAEDAFREAATISPTLLGTWEELGDLYSNDLDRPLDAIEAYENALRFDPAAREAAANQLLFLRRDVLGEGPGARALMDHDNPSPLHEALFAAYEANWGLAREALAKAKAPEDSSDDWLRASAVLLHLNYGSELLEFLRARTARPWVEALVALQLGDRRALQNIAPEIRTAAQTIYDGIEAFLKKLPAKTRRRPVVEPKRKRSRRH